MRKDKKLGPGAKILSRKIGQWNHFSDGPSQTKSDQQLLFYNKISLAPKKLLFPFWKKNVFWKCWFQPASPNCAVFSSNFPTLNPIIHPSRVFKSMYIKRFKRFMSKSKPVFNFMHFRRFRLVNDLKNISDSLNLFLFCSEWRSAWKKGVCNPNLWALLETAW